MLEISLETLKEFQRRTTSIQKNSVLPALGYVKLSTANGRHYLTKNNLRCVCVMLISVNTTLITYDPIMLEEQDLYSLVDNADGQVINISWDDKKIFITDGKIKGYFSKTSPEDFPPTPSYNPSAEKFIFKKEHIDCLNLANNFTLNVETGGNFRFVHVGGDYISAYNGAYFYLNNKYKSLPEARFDSETIAVIDGAAVEQFEFSQNENHYFFLFTGIIYIFTKQESKTVGVKFVHEKFKTPGKEFMISKKGIVDFINYSNRISKSPLCDCSMEQDGINVVKLRMNDESYGKGSKRDLEMSGEIEKFSFDSKLIAAPLKAIPFETLKCKIAQNCLIIQNKETEENFCFIGLQNN